MMKELQEKKIVDWKKWGFERLVLSGKRAGEVLGNQGDSVSRPWSRVWTQLMPNRLTQCKTIPVATRVHTPVA